MPSTTSRVVSRPRASSTVMTPSLPTFSIASEMMRPISSSLLAEMVPTWAMSLPSTGLASLSIAATAALTASSMPRLILHRVGAGGDVLGALAVDRLGEHRRGGGAVAGDVRGLRRHLAHHLGAHVLQ